MAGLRKSKARTSNKSGVVVVCFLVFFILLSIGLGVSFYYERDATDKAKQATAKAIKEKEVMVESRNLYKMLAIHISAGIGGIDPEGPTQIEYQELVRNFLENRKDDKEVRELFSRAHGAMSKELEWIAPPAREELDKELAAAPNDDDKEKVMQKYFKFKKRYRDLYAIALKSEGEYKKQSDDLRTELEKTKDHMANLQKTYQDRMKAINDFLTAAAKNDTAEARKKNVAFAQLLDLHNKLKEDSDKKAIEMDQKLKDKENTIEEIKIKLATIERAKATRRIDDRNDPGVVMISRNSGEFPLALEIGTGRSLWDNPHGHVTRVDLDNRVVYISIGSNLGVKEGLTFNVFPARDGRPHGMMRGTVEVTTVFPTTAIARITSMYDVSGQEILLSDQTRSRLDREANNAFKEGDLLLNMFFNARVAVAGAVNLGGRGVGSPAEQNRQIDHFINLMRSYNVIVDSYVDLNSGDRVGRIHPETRFLIRGDDPTGGKPKAAAAEGADADADRNLEEPRVLKVRGSLDQMKAEARDRGLFIISAENFAFVVGYRPPRPANDVETSLTRPRPPYYTAAKTGVMPVNKNVPGGEMPMQIPNLGANPAMEEKKPAMEEKKPAEEEKKVEEKKDP